MIHEHLDFPFAMTVNIVLVDTSLEKAATEFWLGTHTRGNKGLKDERKGPWIAEEHLDARRKISPPIQPSISKGSVIIRDFRLWHAGMPNQTSEPRIMLALVRFMLL